MINKIKFTVPGMLSAIDQANDDDAITKYECNLVCMFMAPIAILVALMNFYMSYIYWHQSTILPLLDSLFLLAVGIAFGFLLHSGKMKAKLVSHMVSALCGLFFVFIVFRFYPKIGPSVWTFGFIQLVYALGRYSKTMLVYTASSIFISLLLYMFYYGSYPFFADQSYFIHQTAFLLLLILSGVIVHKVNVSRHRRIIRHLEEVKHQSMERHKAEQKNMHMALHDHLTDLPNRVLFHDRLEQAILLAKRNEKELYVLFIDLDYFKTINDTCGHTTGDEVLKRTAQTLSSLFRESDTVARIGGDEFLILLQNIQQPVDYIAQNILDEIGAQFTVNQQNITLTCSIGIAKYPCDGLDADTLVKHADLAMYKAKTEGKNSYMYFDEEMKSRFAYEMNILRSLPHAIKNNELELYYQPQVNGLSRELTGFEALLRWNHPSLGKLAPNEFIHIAERTGAIIPIGEWAIRTACTQNKTWQNQGMAMVPVAVNLSEKQFSDERLTERVHSILNETGLGSNYLEFEITEKMVIQNIFKIKSQMNKLKDLGVRIAIDDFGTGYSTFNYLKELPIERIKIPINFVQGINHNIKDESIIAIIIALAEKLHLSIVAEGVETKTQLDFLTQKFCSDIQGYYFYKPMPAGEIDYSVFNYEIKSTCQ